MTTFSERPLQKARELKQQLYRVNANQDLSTSGREKEIKRILAQGEIDYRQSIDDLKTEFTLIRMEHRKIQERYRRELERARGSMDYNRLRYEADRAIQQVNASHSPGDVADLYDQVLSSGDAHRALAWRETVPPALETRFPYPDDTGMTAHHLARRMRDDLQRMTLTPELQNITREAGELTRRAAEALNSRNEAREIYISAGIHSSDREFIQTADGIRVIENMDVENLGVVRTLEVDTQ